LTGASWANRLLGGIWTVCLLSAFVPVISFAADPCMTNDPPAPRYERYSSCCTLAPIGVTGSGPRSIRVQGYDGRPIRLWPATECGDLMAEQAQLGCWMCTGPRYMGTDFLPFVLSDWPDEAGGVTFNARPELDYWAGQGLSVVRITAVDSTAVLTPD